MIWMVATLGAAQKWKKEKKKKKRKSQHHLSMLHVYSQPFVIDNQTFGEQGSKQNVFPPCMKNLGLTFSNTISIANYYEIDFKWKRL